MVLPFALPSLATVVSVVGGITILPRLSGLLASVRSALPFVGSSTASSGGVLAGLRSTLFGSASRSAATGFLAGTFLDDLPGGGLLKMLLLVGALLIGAVALGQLFTVEV